MECTLRLLRESVHEMHPTVLREPEKFRKALITSVASSTAIETGAPVASIARMREVGEKPDPLTTTQGSAR